MGGGTLDTIINTVATIGGAAFGGPAGAALANTGANLAEGNSFKNSVFSGAAAGVGDEIAPAIGNAVGVGGGANSLTDALGQTTGGSSLTGPGTLGGGISNLFSGSGTDASISSTLPGGTVSSAPISPAGSITSSDLPALPGSTATPAVGSAPNAGTSVGAPGGGAGAISAPSGSGIPSTGGDVTQSNGFYNIASQFPGAPGGNSDNINNFLNQTAGQPNTASTLSAAAGNTPSLAQTGQNIANDVNALGAPAQPSPSAAGGGGGFANFLASNAKYIPSIAGLGLSALEGNKQPKGYNEIQSEAGQLAGQGQQLSQYLQSGTLPPGMQGAVQQNLAAQQAAIKSRYAAQGMSGSSAEQQDLQAAQTQSAAQTAQLAESLLSQGITETGDASKIYQQIMQQQNQEDQNLQSALGSFSSAISGGSGATDAALKNC